MKNNCRFTDRDDDGACASLSPQNAKTFRQFSYSQESMQIAPRNSFLSYRNRGHLESSFSFFLAQRASLVL